MEDARIGLVVDGRYRLDERLAAGGMGVVYRATRVGLSKQVAIKFLHRSHATVPHSRQRFDLEATAMSRLSHPNLVSIIDYGDLDGTPYLVMDYHPGESLRRLVEGGAMPGRRAVAIARQILAGLASAHASGVVHRDLKPDNVLILGKPGDDIVKILDFGVAKLLEGGGRPSEISVVSTGLLGTAQYMSPEQARSQGIDARADLYAVGVMLYEMAVGQLPFDAERDLAVLRMHVEVEPVAPRDLAPKLSPALEQVMLRALEKDRERRWATAEEFSEALRRTPEGRGPLLSEAMPRVSVPITMPRGRSGRRWGWLLLALVGIVAAGVGGLWVADDRGYIDVPWPDWLLRLVD
jgi:eukaryotic-like serine/threonine-protein kinase